MIGAAALAHAYLGLRQMWVPWDMRHHAFFRGHDRQDLGPEVAQQRTQRERRWLNIAIVGGLALLLAWGGALEAASLDHPTTLREVASLAWLPLAPITMAGVARYVVALQAEAEAGVRDLRAQTYCHKSA
ncbi:hypothetical protein WJX81_000810 [Elliptochloris bilobata]|uniref:Uncharacterized protein n=1 Tax=Elliptochloris bilobata TaxID=381761 RepID=A0AAW1RI66_9CHLO